MKCHECEKLKEKLKVLEKRLKRAIETINRHSPRINRVPEK